MDSTSFGQFNFLARPAFTDDLTVALPVQQQRTHRTTIDCCMSAYVHILVRVCAQVFMRARW